MKRFMAIALSVMLLCTCIAPAVFADEAVSSAKSSAAFGDGSFGGATIEKAVSGMYGKSTDEQSQKVKFSLLPSGNKPSDVSKTTQTLNPEDGSKVKISTQFALESSYSSSHMAMGILVDVDDGSGYVAARDTRTFIIPYSGSVTSESGKTNADVPAANARASYPTPVKTWVTYDMVYNIVDRDGTKYVATYSVYVDGQPVFENHKFLIGTNKNTEVSFDKVYGIYLGERGGRKDVHFANMSVTYYPPSCTENPITPNPWEKSGLGSHFGTSTADHILPLKTLSLTDQEIANAAPEGWTFSRVSYDDATDGKLEYIKMVNETTGASYYKRFVAGDYVAEKNIHFTGSRGGNNAVYDGGAGSAMGIKYCGVTSKGSNGLNPEIINTNPKTNDNAYVKLSYTSLPEQLCGLALATQASGAYPYMNGELSGRVAYEWSFMVDEFTTNAIACRMFFNGTVGTDKLGSDYETWIPFQVTNGVLRFDEKGTVTSTGKAQTVLPGEWHHFVIVTDTNKDTVEIYQNGVLIGTRQFTSADEYLLDTVNGMEIGINNSGLSAVNVPQSISLDDLRIGSVSENWTPETASIISSAEGINVNNDTSVILGNLTSAADVTLSEGATAVLSNGTLKVTDASGLVVRYYKVCENEFSLVGFDISDLTTAAGEKSKTVTIENNKAEPYSAVLILAAYSQDGALVSVDVSPSATVYTKQTKQLTAKITVTEDEPVAKFKAFLWKNTDSAYPLFENLGK